MSFPGFLDRPRQAAWEGLGIPDEPTGIGPLDTLLQAIGDPTSLGTLALLAAKRRYAPARGLLQRPRFPETPLSDFPIYGGGAEKLDLFPEGIQRAVRESGKLDAILPLIPPDAVPIGAGRFAAALKAPEGDVLKLAWDHVNPPQISGVVQPTHLAHVGPLTVIRMPMVDLLGNNPLERIRLNHQVSQQIAGQGYDTYDLSPWGGNFGTLGGSPVVLDYGSVTGPYGIRPIRWGSLAAALGLYHGLARGGRED